MSETAGTPDSDGIAESLKRLEERIARIEAHLDLAPPGREAEPLRAAERTEEDEERLEVQVGQNWFAKVGIVVLALGVVFLLTFPYRNLPPALPGVAGLLLVGVIMGLSRLWRDSYPQISRYMLGGGLLLLFFSVLRLSHFGPEPAVTNRGIEAALLGAVVMVTLAVAARRQSPYLAGIALFLGHVAALAAGEPLAVFPMITLLAGVAVAFYLRSGWHAVLVTGTVLAYLTHLVWAFNNPVFGNRFGLVPAPEYNLFFVLVYTAVFAAAGLRLREGEDSRLHESVASAANGGLSFGLFLLLTLTAFATNRGGWHLAAAAVYLAVAVAAWIRRRSKYATFVYAMLGYTALSVAIVAVFAVPDAFVWLCWQSILVVSTAVWFRSRFIVVGNFAVFLIVFLAYLMTAGSISAVSASFGVAALLSARILNWQRDRLELKTELMRNAYLAAALFVIPYTLLHTLPPGLVSLSWLVVAAGYYLFSRILHIRKYRWMALLTMGMTILRVFVVDLVGVDPTFRVVSFLVLGSILLVISMVYTRRRRPPPAGGGTPPPPAPGG